VPAAKIGAKPAYYYQVLASAGEGIGGGPRAIYYPNRGLSARLFKPANGGTIAATDTVVV
jgi:hypothetical protein